MLIVWYHVTWVINFATLIGALSAVVGMYRAQKVTHSLANVPRCNY